MVNKALYHVLDIYWCCVARLRSNSRDRYWQSCKFMSFIIKYTFIRYASKLQAAHMFLCVISLCIALQKLYTTGQTWLGIAVTIGYTYFGLSGKVAPEQDGNDKTDERKNDAAIQGTIGGSGSGGGGVGVNGREREEASFTDTDERKEGRELLA